MKVLESYYPAPQETDFGARGKMYEYDLRLEVGIDEGVEEIPLHNVFVRFLKNLTNAADHPIEVTDVKDRLVNSTSVPEGDEFRKNFSVEQAPGKIRKVFVGFKLKSLTPMSVLKHRMFAFLRDNKLYLRIHAGGYQYGLRLAFLGYLRHENPNTADVQEWKDTFIREINAVWKHATMIPEDIKKQILQKFPRQVTKAKVSFPINISKEILHATNGEKRKSKQLYSWLLHPMRLHRQSRNYWKESC